jgi:hypothetical protein
VLRRYVATNGNIMGDFPSRGVCAVSCELAALLDKSDQTRARNAAKYRKTQRESP